MSSLSSRLREATHDVHRQAESAPFMRRFLRGAVTRAEYARLLANLAPIYRGLENALATDPAAGRLAALRLEGLARHPALIADLDELAGATAGEPRPSPGDTALAYAQRIDDLRRQEPIRLAAHAYVRYLGDLAGGQMLRRVIERSIDAPVRFHDFGGPERVVALAASFRAGLDGLALDATEADAVVDEALQAFRRHERMFDELDAIDAAASDAARS